MTPTHKRKIFLIAISSNSIIFFLLAALHFYWAFGGKIWLDDVLPSNSANTQKLEPTTFQCLAVAVGLLVLAFITIGANGLIKRKYFKYGTLVIAIIFLLRAIGDFKFIGFFKTIMGTKFAINDTLIFSPLCIIIAIFSMLIFFGGSKVHSKSGTGN